MKNEWFRVWGWIYRPAALPGWIAVARASRCGRTSRSMRRTPTPWRASSLAANSPEGPAPKTSFKAS